MGRDGLKPEMPPGGPYQAILELARPYLATRDNEEHTEWSVACAWHLLSLEGGQAEVVIPGVILHDVGWSALSEERQLLAFGPKTDPELNRVHEVAGARIAAHILALVDYDPNSSKEIVEIVLGHDSRLEALSLNDSLVKDADKLFRLSRRGYVTHGRRFALEPRQYLDILTARFESWFFTRTAQVLASQALEELRSELSELEAEPGVWR